MGSEFQAPRGTFDLLPADAGGRHRIEATAGGILERAGYGRVDTPTFEATELFSRGVGESTDIVRKEMFSFEDLGGRSMTLRPEGTAPICRAYIEHGMHKLAQPVKLWYSGAFYRYEAPQAGRYRQFSQIGAEAIGSDSPLVDAELILLLDEWLRQLGVGGLTLRLSSLGSQDLRTAYREDLQTYLRSHEDGLSREVRERIELNPLRAFDADDASTRAVMAGAPTMLDRLEGDDAAHFDQVRALLDAAGVAYELDGTLVRGLDYYTRTVFEFESSELGAQSGVAGGGRYDGLVEQLGGPSTPAAGWAAGVERIATLLSAGPSPEPVIQAFVAASDEQRDQAFALTSQLRRAGLDADLDLSGRSVKGQMKHADRLGARAVLILDEGDVRLRDMRTGEQTPVAPDAMQIAEMLREL